MDKSFLFQTPQERKQLFMQAMQKKFSLSGKKPNTSNNSENDNETNENADPCLSMVSNHTDNVKSLHFPYQSSNEKGIVGREKTILSNEQHLLKNPVGTRTLTESCNQTLFELCQKQSEPSMKSRFILPKLRKQVEENVPIGDPSNIIAPAKLNYFNKDTVEYVDTKLNNLTLSKQNDETSESAQNWHQRKLNNYSNFKSREIESNEDETYQLKAKKIHYTAFYNDADDDDNVDTDATKNSMDTYDENKCNKYKISIKISIPNYDSLPQKKYEPSGIGALFEAMPCENQENLDIPIIPYNVKNGTNGQDSTIARFNFDKPSPDDIVLSKRRDRGLIHK